MPEIISIAAIVLTLVYVTIVLFLISGWHRLEKHKSTAQHLKTFVSVLIAARNEENHIGDTIRDILNQNFPQSQLEIIVVDDHSTDRTASVVRSFSDRGVKLIQLNEREPLNSYKKKAISEAINQASGELIVVTDADCRMGGGWLSAMVSLYEERESYLISGPVVYHEDKTLFERLQTLEFLYLIGLGAAGIGAKKASTCNGANLAYRREIFFEVGGFKDIDELASGDDELFLHKVAAQYPDRIDFCKDEEAIVYTEAKVDLQAFINQRKRWASKSTRYKDKSIVVLGVSVWLFNLFLLLSFLSAPFFPTLWPSVLYCLIIKMSVEFVFLYPVCGFAKRSSYLPLLPLLSILHILYLVFIGIAGNSGRYQWKGRLVR